MVSIDPWMAAFAVASLVFALALGWSRRAAVRALAKAEDAERRAAEEHGWAQDLRRRLESAAFPGPAAGAAVDLQRVTRAVRDVAGSATRRDVAESLACAAETLLAPRGWAVLLAVDGPGGDLVVAESGGEPRAEAWKPGARVPTHSGRVGLAVRRRVSMTPDDLALEPPVVRRQVEQSELRAFPSDVVVPVVCGERVAAVVAVAGTDVASGPAREALEIVARTAALVLARVEAQAPGPDDRDPVTGLGDRRWFHATAAAELERLTREHRSAAVVLFALGGAPRDERTRDRLLRGVAQIVRPQVRDSDLLARWREDAIVALLGDSDAGVAHVVASRVHAAVASLARGVDGTGELTLVSGLAAADRADPSSPDLDRLIAAADARLRAASGAPAPSDPPSAATAEPRSERPTEEVASFSR